MRLSLLPLAALATANLIAVRPSKPDLVLAQLLDPAMGFLDCSRGDATVKALCSVVTQRAGSMLAGASIRIDAAGLLFTYDNATDIKVDTGHSCSVTANIKNTRAEARLSSQTWLDFSGNPLSVSDPGLFLAELPVELAARIDIQQRFGQRLLGKCHKLGTDSFKVSGGVKTTAKVAVLFSFGPAPVRVDAQGNWVFTIRPITKVAAQLGKTDIDFNVSGYSFVSGIVTAALGGTSSALKAVTHLLKGDSLSRAWSDVKRMVLDVAVGSVLSIPFDLLDNLVETLAQAYIDEKKGKLVTEYSGEMEKKLREMLAKALGLDANGERTFVIKKEVVALVSQFGVTADVFLPDKPAGYCAKDADCNDGVYCNGVERCVSEKCVAGTRPCDGAGGACVEASKTCRRIAGCTTGRLIGGIREICQLP
ncbi:hypothetical protein QBC39DRAFT_262377 [Podospora conica]|nr:hypothetical protein QBC39DRAFT_262377 [Schizothecium conicum]